MRTRLSTILSVLITAIGFATSAAHAAPNLPTRSSAQAGVWVSATPHELAGATWDFDISLNTHSVPLQDDLEKSAALVADDGKTFAPLKWQGDPPGGHHRKGMLQFKPITPLPASIELRITRASEAKPRVFQWTLK